MKESQSSSNNPCVEKLDEKVASMKSALNSLSEVVNKMRQEHEVTPTVQDFTTIQGITEQMFVELCGLRNLFNSVLQSAQARVANVGERCRLLVVDDNPTNRKVLTFMLTRRGHEVLEAVNGREACDLVTSKPIDGIFMDLSMPIMDGMEATKFIRQDLPEPYCHIPIFAVTAHSLPETRVACLKAGMNGFIAKPISVADIVRAIDAIRSRSEVTATRAHA